MSESNPIKRIFDLYTSDLKSEDIERLIKRESNEIYEFYKNQIPKADPTKNKFTRGLIFARSLFNAFLLKMTAARRIFYLVALIIFVFGLFNNIDSYLIFGFIIINLLLAFELADKLTVKSELTLARKIQDSLMPQIPPSFTNFQVSTYYEAANEVGGDYFDFISKDGDEDCTYLVVGDISGKGMAAALYMVRVQSILQFLVKSFSGVKDIMINLKKYFAEKLKKEYFLTILIAKVADGKLTICKAGHPPVLHFKSAAGTVENINPKGIGIGLNDKGVFEQTIEELDLEPQAGDILVFYTDGIIEAMNFTNAQFGLERLSNLIKDNAAKTAEEIKSIVVDYLKRFRGNAASNDDATLIILKAV